MISCKSWIQFSNCFILLCHDIILAGKQVSWHIKNYITYRQISMLYVAIRHWVLSSCRFLANNNWDCSTIIAQNTIQMSISFVFCVSAIRHDSSLSKYRKQKQSPLEIFKMAHVQGGDCFCLRYLQSDESWRIALTQKTMEMDFCIVFCDHCIKIYIFCCFKQSDLND